MPSLWGSPGSTNIVQTPGTPAVRPPGYRFASWLASQLPALMNTPFPTYQGQLDPGLSPTMQDVIRRAQGYAQSSPPEVLAGAAGTLGRFMNPTYRNPWHALFNANGGGGTPAAGTMGGGTASGGASPWGVGGRPETFGGAPNYFQADPNRRVYGGRTAGSYGWNMEAPPVSHGPLPAPAGQSDFDTFTAMYAGGQ